MRLALALLLLISAPAVTGAEALPTRIELYTIGSGDDVFEAFGHAALCVIDELEPRGVCYNYGTFDFSDPAQLVLDVLRGQARFWVSRMPLPLMLQAYIEDDRTIYRQKLELGAEAAEALAARLEEELLPENRTYTYHHYGDNCSTRIRDHIDRAFGGRLSAGAGRGSGVSFRELTQRGFASDIFLLAAMELLVGRRVDREATAWQAMFIPDVMRVEVARRFDAAPEVIYTRNGPVPTLSPLAGRRATWAAALLLTLMVVAGSVAGGDRSFRWAVRLTGFVFGVAGIGVAGMALVATLPELRQNEVLLLLLPTDLALVFLRGRALFGYTSARLVLCVLVAVGLLAGLLIQPIWAVWAFATGPLAVAAFRARRAQARHRPDETPGRAPG